MTTYRDRHLAGHHDAEKLADKQAAKDARDKAKASTTAAKK